MRAERELPLDGVEVVRAEGDRGDALAALRGDPDVVWAEPNLPRRIAAEPLGGLLWGLQNTGQSVWWRAASRTPTSTRPRRGRSRAAPA